MLISPILRGGRRISSSSFLSRCPSRYYLPVASYGTIFTVMSSNGWREDVVSKRLAQGHKGLTVHSCFFDFLRQMRHLVLLTIQLS